MTLDEQKVWDGSNATDACHPECFVPCRCLILEGGDGRVWAQLCPLCPLRRLCPPCRCNCFSMMPALVCLRFFGDGTPKREREYVQRTPQVSGLSCLSRSVSRVKRDVLSGAMKGPLGQRAHPRVVKAAPSCVLIQNEISDELCGECSAQSGCFSWPDHDTNSPMHIADKIQ